MNGILPVVILGQIGVIVADAAVSAHEPTFGPTFWATVGLIFTTVAGGLFQLYREGRARRWEREDAKSKFAHEQKAQERQETITSKIDENTKISVAAFAAANNLNEKMLQTQQVATAAVETAAKAIETVAAVVPPK